MLKCRDECCDEKRYENRVERGQESLGCARRLPTPVLLGTRRIRVQTAPDPPRR